MEITGLLTEKDLCFTYFSDPQSIGPYIIPAGFRVPLLENRKCSRVTSGDLHFLTHAGVHGWLSSCTPIHSLDESVAHRRPKSEKRVWLISGGSGGAKLHCLD